MIRMTERPDAAAPPSPLRWFEERLARIGITGRFGRDSVLAVAAALATLAFHWTLLPLAAVDLDVALTEAQSWTLTWAAAVQSLVLCLRRVRLWSCLAAVMACQIVIVAAVPDLTANGLGVIIVFYTLGTLAPLRFTVTAAIASTVVGGIVAAMSLWARDGDPMLMLGHVSSSALTEGPR